MPNLVATAALAVIAFVAVKGGTALVEEMQFRTWKAEHECTLVRNTGKAISSLNMTNPTIRPYPPYHKRVYVCSVGGAPMMVMEE